MQVNTGIAVNEILKERERQDTLKAEGRFKFTCADLEMTFDECMMVLMEEVGELCRATLEYKMLTFERLGDHVRGNVGQAKLREECIQVAAVALSMTERFVDKDAAV